MIVGEREIGKNEGERECSLRRERNAFEREGERRRYCSESEQKTRERQRCRP